MDEWNGGEQLLCPVNDLSLPNLSGRGDNEYKRFGNNPCASQLAGLTRKLHHGLMIPALEELCVPALLERMHEFLLGMQHVTLECVVLSHSCCRHR